MNSRIFQNDNFFLKQKESPERIKLEPKRNNTFKLLENDDISRQKLYYKNYLKENSMSNIKSIKYNKFKELNEIASQDKKSLKITSSILPLIKKYDWKPNLDFLSNKNSLINIKKSNRFNDLDSKYLYLEYIKDNSENRKANEATYIEIDPHQIISSLTEFPNIKQIFQTLTKKINMRNIIKYKYKNKFNSKIDINDIFSNLEKYRKNNNINNINSQGNYQNITYDLNISSTFVSSDFRNKSNYSILELFFLDMINKVINKTILFHDKANKNINEDFMLKEYKNQIKKLQIFFEEKMNDKNISNLLGLQKDNCKIEYSQKKIKVKKRILFREMPKGNISNKLIKRKASHEELFYDINGQKNKLILSKDSSKGIQNKGLQKLSNKNNDSNTFLKPKLNIYKLDIVPKINIIDFDELLNKIQNNKLDIKGDYSSINKNILKKLFELNNKKIKFGNHMIEEKTKILKKKNNLFTNVDSKYFSRNNNYRKFNRKKLFIQNELSNDKDENEKVINTKSNETNLSINENEFLKVLSQKDQKINFKEKINIEKIGIKNNFGIAKVGFNKTIDKIRKMHFNKSNKNRKNKIQRYHFSFLNTIYGKINTKRKMKIDELDYKEEILQKGYQLLYNIFQQKQKFALIQNKSAEDVFMTNIGKDKYDTKHNFTLEKGTSTGDM